jgi:lipopolysaccharide/colanic/teichoic acid biosynthesis glycosyltransferase
LTTRNTKQNTEQGENTLTLRNSVSEETRRSFVERSGAESERTILGEEAFRRMISIERKRTERSQKPFLLMLLDGGNRQATKKSSKALNSVVSTLLASTRETDITGWYENGTTVGVMFTDLEFDDKSMVLSTMLARVSATLRDNVPFEQFNQISISFHFFPDDWDHDSSERPSNPALYPDLDRHHSNRRLLSSMKRLIDIVGGALALLVFSPILAMIAVAIKATSKGPVFFKQQRVGQYGKKFTFLKFRSMKVGNDSSVHEEYVKKLIAGQAERKSANGNGEGVFKLTNDCRITRVGAFLRRTSLDEMPQFLNVLTGDMSLVGPRPAIPYEVAAYQTWHRRRVLEVKPGITGLWQVNGRSRVSFDDMVRLDLQYARVWSPWMDIKILFLTPRAVLLGEGAH